ncbi:MAG TPA: bifunctional phosphoglucose/phosphomannose isomerase [Acidimicrobiales bacterium]|nr:bifunctional phosphoglucose/phosphomannose isomerase [Acidimicrobiales bacterium]
MTAPPLDTFGMWDATWGRPEQMETAMAEALQLDGLPDRDSVENVVVIGMGGSGIVGDILAATAGPFMAVPVVTVKSYTLPAFVGEGSLVFAVSFSGDTEETIEAATEAAVQGAKIVMVTAGGELAKLAAGWGSPLALVPASIPQPRAALGAMAVPPLVALEQIGLFPGASQWLNLSIEHMKRRRDVLAADGSAAAEVARRIGRTIPLIHGAGALGAAAAERWKTQVNENAKAPAFYAVQPELSHNEVQGWGQHGDVTRQVLTLVTLRHDAEHPQVIRRFEIVADLMGEIVAGIVEVRAEGEGELAQLFDLMLFGDYVTLHMAANEGIDPGPVPALAEIKQQLTDGWAVSGRGGPTP